MQESAGVSRTGTLSDARKTGKIALVVTRDLLRLDYRIRIWILCELLKKLHETSPAEIRSLLNFIEKLPHPDYDETYEDLEGLLPPNR